MEVNGELWKVWSSHVTSTRTHDVTRRDSKQPLRPLSVGKHSFNWRERDERREVSQPKYLLSITQWNLLKVSWAQHWPAHSFIFSVERLD